MLFVLFVVHISLSGSSGSSGDYLFSASSAPSVVNPSSPIQELEPGATPCRGGRCAARYPHGPPAASKQKYFRL